MSHINPLAREISAKIVYYGPGLSGKTTSLKYLYSVIRPERRGELVTLATEGDRTLFFDFLPISIDRVHDMPVRLQLYTVPGQVFYSSTRKLVLNGADGVVFVADSQEAARDSNKNSLQDLSDNLVELGTDLSRFPHVFQFNKRDIDGVLPVATLNAELNRHNAPALETSAARGTGVLNALRQITQMVIADLKRKQAAPRRATTMVGSVGVVEDPAESGGIAARISAAAAEQHQAEPTAAPAAPAPPTPLPTPAAQESAPFNPPQTLPGDTPVASMPPGALGISFASLWPAEAADMVRGVERQLLAGQWGVSLRSAAAALAALLESLPGVPGSDGPMTKGALLGLDGREYLRLCRLASAPDGAISEQDALFALHMLVSARIKQREI